MGETNNNHIYKTYQTIIMVYHQLVWSVTGSMVCHQLMVPICELRAAVHAGDTSYILEQDQSLVGIACCHV